MKPDKPAMRDFKRDEAAVGKLSPEQYREMTDARTVKRNGRFPG
jgi:hypothetical protein